VLKVDARRDDVAPGFVFIAPKRGAGRNGAQIVNNDGEPVWFYPVESPDDQIMDFRVQQFRGEPVLTWWQGLTNLGRGFGHWVIRDRSYQPVATVQIGNGLPGGDLHDFQITPQNTALVGTYNEIRWDLTSLGGPSDGSAFDGIVQEIDIPTGAVMFEWHSLDHIAIEETYEQVDPEADPAPMDYFHLNSVAIDGDGNIVLSARNTWAAYKITRGIGDVIWRLGGKKSDFDMGPDATTAFQHDIRPQDGGEFSIFDNGSETPEPPESRGLVLRVDQTAMTAEVAREFRHPDPIFAANQGNLQILPNGNAIVGWGAQPVVSEFTASGELICDWRLPKEKQTYRAYKFEWSATPAEPPALIVEREDPGDLTAYVSWNGATDVASWQLLTGPGESDLSESGDPVPRATFETKLAVPAEAPFVAARALDADGKSLGEARPVSVPR
jgi:hypothetical protein